MKNSFFVIFDKIQHPIRQVTKDDAHRYSFFGSEMTEEKPMSSTEYCSCLHWACEKTISFNT